MQFHAPLPISRHPGDPRALWRRLFLEALQPGDTSPQTIATALLTGALLSGTSLFKVVDELVQIGLRGPLEAFPAPYVAHLRARVLNLDTRRDLPYALGALAASWGWMAEPFIRQQLPLQMDSEQDPYGADLCAIFHAELDPQPRFGYRPAQLRIALLRTAVALGQPVATVLPALIERGLVVPPEVVPVTTRDALLAQDPSQYSPLVAELVGAWRNALGRAEIAFGGEVIPLRRAR